MLRYIRIQGRENSRVTKYPKGVFSLCWNLMRDGMLTPAEEALWISVDTWFKEHLPEPEPCRNHSQAVTFFKCENAAEMLEKLQPALALPDKYGRAYDVVYTNFVGTVIYEDPWQVAVAVRDGKPVCAGGAEE